MLLKHAHLKFKGTLCIINYVFSQTKTHKMNGRSTRISMQNVQQKQAKESPKKRHIKPTKWYVSPCLGTSSGRDIYDGIFED